MGSSGGMTLREGKHHSLSAKESMLEGIDGRKWLAMGGTNGKEGDIRLNPLVGGFAEEMKMNQWVKGNQLGHIAYPLVARREWSPNLIQC